MKTVKRIAAQGDVVFIRVPALPTSAIEVTHCGRVVVAHSETGHHHAIDSKALSYFEVPGQSLVSYLRFEEGIGGGAEVVHHRPWDTHEALKLLGGPGDIWQVKRQREWSPEGWRRVED